MKFNLIIILLLLNFSCDQKEKKTETATNTTETKKKKVVAEKPQKTKEGKAQYNEIFDLWTEGRFNAFERLAFQFIDKYENSIYSDSTKQLKKKVKNMRDSLASTKDSLRQNKSYEYFYTLKLPSLDTINYDSYNLWTYRFPNTFTEVDRDLFNSKFYESWYISQQPLSAKYLTLAVGHFNDCENYIYLYSIDSSFKVADKMEVYRNGCFHFEEENIQYKNYLVNEFNYKTTAYFHPDSTFSFQVENIYELTDTLSGDKIKRVGREEVTQYSIDDNGRFVEIGKEINTEPFIQKKSIENR